LERPVSLCTLFGIHFAKAIAASENYVIEILMTGSLLEIWMYIGERKYVLTWILRISGLCPSSSRILETSKNNLSETGYVSILRRGGTDFYSLGPHKRSYPHSLDNLCHIHYSYLIT
jgi:hypothetical protein